MKKANVYHNKEGSLFFIEKLLYDFYETGSNCIFQQAINSIQTVYDAFLTYDLDYTDNYSGHTPRQVIAHLQDYNPNLKLHQKPYTDIDHALKDVETGQPVIMIVSSDNPCWLKTNNLHGDAIVTRFGGNVMKKPDVGYHAYLIWGLDVGKGNVLLRESSSKYANNGFFQMPLDLVRKKPKSAAYFSFVVK